MKAAEILCPEKQQLFKNISLSTNTLAERVKDLAGGIQCQLKEKRRNCVAYSIAIDESTDVKVIAQLAVFVRGVNEDFELVEELLELVPMKGKTGAVEIFSQLVTLLNKFELPWGKMVWFVSDGAPAMIGKNNGVAAKLKRKRN
jgi:transposase-like protein